MIIVNIYHIVFKINVWAISGDQLLSVRWIKQNETRCEWRLSFGITHQNIFRNFLACSKYLFGSSIMQMSNIIQINIETHIFLYFFFHQMILSLLILSHPNRLRISHMCTKSWQLKWFFFSFRFLYLAKLTNTNTRHIAIHLIIIVISTFPLFLFLLWNHCFTSQFQLQYFIEIFALPSVESDSSMRVVTNANIFHFPFIK